MEKETKGSKPENDLTGDMKKEDEPKEILIFKGEQVWQQQLAKLTPEERKKLNEDILNSPELLKLGNLKLENTQEKKD